MHVVQNELQHLRYVSHFDLTAGDKSYHTPEARLFERALTLSHMTNDQL